MSLSSATKKGQVSLDSFFKPAQPASKSAAPSSQLTPRPAFQAPPANTMVRRPFTASSQHCNSTSSLSLPPNDEASDIYEFPISPPKLAESSSAPERVVKGSDDEEDDSDSSLEDLTTILQTKRPINGPKPNAATPSTPTSSRTKAFHISPVPLLSKNQFDLKSLASHAEADRKMEASSKRVKAMQKASQRKENVPPRGDNAGSKLKHNDLLHSVVADQEDVDVHKVARAVMRTEAILSEQRWYFLDTRTNVTKPKRIPFPTKSVPENWTSDLKDAQIRHQAFVSGFAEDMVSFGKVLPDEIFLWMLDEICLESSEPLRVSYCNVLKASTEQIQRLMVPNVIRKMFEMAGASSAATAVTDKIRTVPALSEPYIKRNLANLRCVVRFFGQIAKILQARSYVVQLLLRMCVDRMVLENVEVFDLVQESINRLSRYVSDDAWETCVQEICTVLFNSVDQAILRLQMVQCTPSTTARTHDLKRRLAMSFYFNDLFYSTKHSHLIMDLNKFINRLDDRNFDTNSQTDYRELAALISLLDIAVDDARSTGLDLSDPATEDQFDKNIEDFGATIKDIMKSIGNPGAAYISKIEAKEILDLVSQRILDTLRSKPKARITVFDRKEDNFEKEKKGMAAFVKKGSTANEINGQASTDSLVK